MPSGTGIPRGSPLHLARLWHGPTGELVATAVALHPSRPVKQVGHDIEAAPTQHLADACLYRDAFGVHGRLRLHIG
jgi:hypothetical protein